MKSQLYLVDDDDQLRLHLANLLRQLSYEVEAFATADAFLQRPSCTVPAVLILDMRMPGMSGVELQAELARRACLLPIIFISGQSEPQETIDALKSGAIDFLWKPFTKDQLVAAIEKGLIMASQLASQARRSAELAWRIALLSQRERQALTLILQGHTNKGLSQAMGVLPDTAKKYRASILEKMEAATLAELIDLCRGLNLERLLAS